jgi:hypothetical protein
MTEQSNEKYLERGISNLEGDKLQDEILRVTANMKQQHVAASARIAWPRFFSTLKKAFAGLNPVAPNFFGGVLVSIALAVAVFTFVVPAWGPDQVKEPTLLSEADEVDRRMRPEPVVLQEAGVSEEKHQSMDELDWQELMLLQDEISFASL